MSTICLLPPERSHMVSSPLLAHDVVAGTTGSLLGPPLSELQAVTIIMVVTAARAGHQGRVLISTLLQVGCRRSFDADDHLLTTGRRARYLVLHTIALIRFRFEMFEVGRRVS